MTFKTLFRHDNIQTALTLISASIGFASWQSSRPVAGCHVRSQYDKNTYGHPLRVCQEIKFGNLGTVPMKVRYISMKNKRGEEIKSPKDLKIPSNLCEIRGAFELFRDYGKEGRVFAVGCGVQDMVSLITFFPLRSLERCDVDSQMKWIDDVKQHLDSQQFVIEARITRADVPEWAQFLFYSTKKISVHALSDQK